VRTLPLMNRSLALLAAALVVAAPAAAQRATRDWSPGDRTIIGDFSHVTSVAAASDRVFITSQASLLVWSPLFQRWEGPWDPPEPALLARVFASVVDPIDNTLWMARPDGWVHYQPEIQAWDHGSVQGGVRDIAFDLDDPLGGLRLLTASGWVVVQRGGGIPTPGSPPARPLRPTSVEEAIRANPSLQANSAGILLDGRLRQARYTSAARAFDRRGWYLGTWGLGVLYFPEGAALPQRLGFGLPGASVGAVMAAPGGVWVTTDRTAQSEPAFTFVAADLTDFSTVQGPPATGLPFDESRRLIAQGSALWAATDAGAVRVEPQAQRTQLFDEGRGLPDGRVYSVASRQGQITLGTARGIVRIDDSLRVRRIAPSFGDPVYAVAVSGDTVWVGTDGGVYAALPGQPSLSRPKSIGATASLQVPVFALRFNADTLVGMTADGLIWRNPKGGAWTAGPVLSTVLGRLVAFVPDGGGFWVAGQKGVAFARLNTPPIRPLIGGDLPGAVRDVAVDVDHLWVGTSAGLVRWRLEVIRP
jgi:hypothetical protein